MYITFDLETLGNTSNAPIVQIGAVVFDIEGNITNRFDMSCDLETIPQDVFHVDYSTIKWWMGQMASNRELIHVFNGTYPFKDMIKAYAMWVGEMQLNYGDDITFWSHATFDPPIVNNNFRVVGVKNPVHFRRHRDIRTLTHLAGRINIKEDKGNAHNAIDDAIYQAKYISKGLRMLKEKGLVF